MAWPPLSWSESPEALASQLKGWLRLSTWSPRAGGAHNWPGHTPFLSPAQAWHASHLSSTPASVTDSGGGLMDDLCHPVIQGLGLGCLPRGETPSPVKPLCWTRPRRTGAQGFTRTRLRGELPGEENRQHAGEASAQVSPDRIQLVQPRSRVAPGCGPDGVAGGPQGMLLHEGGLCQGRLWGEPKAQKLGPTSAHSSHPQT